MDTAQQNTFSFFTGRPESDALDFGWQDIQQGWTKSSFEGRTWYDDGKMTEQDIEPLLKKFGLIEVFGQKPWPTVEFLRHMSPAQLIAMRRAWEQEHNVPCLEVRSERAGGEDKAEQIIGLAEQPVAA